jgi:hypothetical protein
MVATGTQCLSLAFRCQRGSDRTGDLAGELFIAGRCEMDDGRQLDCFQPRFGEGIEVVNGDAVLLHDLGCNFVVFHIVARDPARRTGRDGCG